tara:strand:+ start:341 stop:565 length:225 start_codon:yes stop_codon:yes gene_type:complete
MELKIDQHDLNYALSDTSIEGGYVKFYDQLKEALDQHTDKDIENFKSILLYTDSKLDVESLDKIEIIYKYSCLI